MDAIDSQPHSIDKLENKIRQLVMAVGRREGKLLSHPIQNPKGQQFE